jgi:hypothetical protein
MSRRSSSTRGELFIVNNRNVDWKVLRHRHDWPCAIAAASCGAGFPWDLHDWEWSGEMMIEKERTR